MKIAFAGASGTGKTTLAKFVGEKYGWPLCPVGSRDVSTAMGFTSPYDVDKAGKRAEFQERLRHEKLAWEQAQASFVTDRTPFDNMVYYTLHDPQAVTQKFWDACTEQLRRYDLVFFCPTHAYHAIGGDTARVDSVVYHKLYERLLFPLLEEAMATTFKPEPGDARAADRSKRLVTVNAMTLEDRKDDVDYMVRIYGKLPRAPHARP